MKNRFFSLGNVDAECNLFIAHHMSLSHGVIDCLLALSLVKHPHDNLGRSYPYKIPPRKLFPSQLA